ncbi:hypothetical protein ACPCA8_26675 [Streptomyces capoamus]|uniref:hypothetical protein n=1 Tax=Streptomyces capoamus TaxID=68183 RepID=UPI003C2FAFD2
MRRAPHGVRGRARSAREALPREDGTFPDADVTGKEHTAAGPDGPPGLPPPLPPPTV